MSSSPGQSASEMFCLPGLGVILLYHIQNNHGFTLLFVSHIIHLMLFTIGEEIRKERKRRKISQGTIAKNLGMSRSTISQIETGTVQEVGIRKLIRILEYLELELSVRPAGAPPTLDELREQNRNLISSPEPLERW